jgi:hypothetical protein
MTYRPDAGNSFMVSFHSPAIEGMDSSMQRAAHRIRVFFNIGPPCFPVAERLVKRSVVRATTSLTAAAATVRLAGELVWLDGTRLLNDISGISKSSHLRGEVTALWSNASGF